MSCRTHRGCAATRTAGRRADASVPAVRTLLLAPLLALACISQADQEKLDIHKIEAKHYYDFGDYERSSEQCRQGLAIDPDDASLNLQLGYGLLMLSTPKSLEEAEQIFESRIGAFGSSDWRIFLGAGMTAQERARLLAGAKSQPDPDAVARLRTRARDRLDRAYELSRSGNENNTPPDLLYHLALLDLDEGRPQLFRQHAEEGVKLMQTADKFFAAQLRQQSDDQDKKRTDHDRSVNAERARLLLHELARLAWGQESRDATAAAGYMRTLEQFGPLARPDFFNRGRILEATGDLEGAVADYSKFIDLSADVADENVTRAIQSLQKLRSQLAERRTESPPPSR